MHTTVRYFLLLAMMIGSTEVVCGQELMEYDTRFFDMNGTEINTISVGEMFTARTQVSDLRIGGTGVFQGFSSLNFDAPAFDAIGGVSHIAPFTNNTAGDAATDGIIFEAGGFDGTLSFPGVIEGGLWEITMRADLAGEYDFSQSFATTSGRDTLMFGINDPVQESQIRFTTRQLTVTSAVPEPGTAGAMLLIAAAGSILRRRRT